MLSVQFLGLPGAGKTAIRQSLVRSLREDGETRFLTVEDAFLCVARKEVDRIYRPALRYLPGEIAKRLSNKLMNRSLMQFEAQNRFLARNGKALDAFLSSDIYTDMSINDRTIVISAFLESGSIHECIHDRFSNETVVFFEEGFVQRSFMFISKKDKQYRALPNLYSYLENIPLPDIIIHVYADHEACYKRMLERPEGLTNRLKQADREGILNFLSIARSHIEHVMAWLGGKPSVSIINVQNDKSLEGIIPELKNRITKITDFQGHEVNSAYEKE